jgi:hypothetical protein
MATLKHRRSGQVRPLPARTLVGRAPYSAVRLDGIHVSGEHATIVWTNGRWECRDLGSRNGTFVDTRRLPPGDPAALLAGAVLCFGDPEDPWDLVDDGAPSAVAVHLVTGELRTAQDTILALPDEEHPEALVYADTAGRWLLEQGDSGARPLKPDEVVQAGGSSWRISVPEALPGTASMHVLASLENVKLRFAVSRDEEHVQLTVLARGAERPLEVREHWYTLLTLARRRLDDKELPASEQGWIERNDLLKMLGVDSNTLNVAIYRARRQLQAAGVDGAAALVEVRRGQRRIGIGVERLEVVPL